jgi:hypothetical protein
MKILGYSPNMRFANAPALSVEVGIDDPDTGEMTSTHLRFVDDEAREIFEMIPNPALGGSGTIATGKIDLDVMQAKVARRIAEAREVPQAIHARLAASEKALANTRAAVAAANEAEKRVVAAEKSLREIVEANEAAKIEGEAAADRRRVEVEALEARAADVLRTLKAARPE